MQYYGFGSQVPSKHHLILVFKVKGGQPFIKRGGQPNHNAPANKNIQAQAKTVATDNAGNPVLKSSISTLNGDKK